MILIALGLAMTHTPGHFLKECHNNPIALHHINVSQVHYLRLRKTCNHTFAPDHCRFQTISMHRFEPAVTDGFLVITRANGVSTTITEHRQEKHGEPFTLTPYVTTIKLEEVDYGDPGCTITVGGEDGVASFVVGKAEDWWLGFTIPYWSYQIQWGWAFASVSIWFWPFYVYAALVYTISYRNTSVRVVVTMLAFSMAIDFAWPAMATAIALGEVPGSAIWNILIALRILLYWVLLYMIIVPPDEGTLWLRVLGYIILMSLCTFMGIGAYMLVPVVILYHEHTKLFIKST